MNVTERENERERGRERERKRESKMGRGRAAKEKTKDGGVNNTKTQILRLFNRLLPVASHEAHLFPALVSLSWPQLILETNTCLLMSQFNWKLTTKYHSKTDNYLNLPLLLIP